MTATRDGDEDASTESSYLDVQTAKADGTPEGDDDNDLAQTVAEFLREANFPGASVAESEPPDARYRELVEHSREGEARIMPTRPPGPGDPRLDL